jgi:hypothetical protein
MEKSLVPRVRAILIAGKAALAGALIAAVALAGLPRAAAGAPGAVPTERHSGVVGVWEGTSLATCPGSAANRCNAQQKITLTLVEGEGGRLGGFYKCAYGNMNCYNMNETGKIVSVELSGALLRALVAMPDGTSCTFNGRLAENLLSGGYSCYGGGSLLERGSWRATRAY